MLVITGLNHESAPENIRERAAFIKRTALVALEKLTSNEKITEAIVLSTCNRSEIFIITEDEDFGRSVLEEIYKEKDPSLLNYLYSYVGEAAITHLFELACGLDSMVIGEDQILGQLREALELAQSGGYSGKFLNQYVREAITFAKRVKTVSKLSEVPRSLPATAVKYLKRYPDYKNLRVLIVGSGKMGRLALKHLGAEGFLNVTMSNRTYHPGDEYREIFSPIKVIDYYDRYKILDETDVVISATSSPHTIFKKEKIPQDKELLFIDLALPMDVEREIGEMEKVRVLGIDDFKEYINKKRVWQSEKISEIRKEITPAVKNLIEWTEHAEIDSIVSLLNENARAQAEKTIENLNRRYHFSGKDLKYLEKNVRSGFNNLVRPTLLKLKKIETPLEREIVEEAVKIIENQKITRKNR